MAVQNPGAIKARIAEQIRAGQVRFTIHAHQEMAEEGFTLDDVFEGLKWPTPTQRKD